MVVSTEKPFSTPSFWIAAIPTGMHAWWYPLVFENINTAGFFAMGIAAEKISNKKGNRTIATIFFILQYIFINNCKALPTFYRQGDSMTCGNTANKIIKH